MEQYPEPKQVSSSLIPDGVMVQREDDGTGVGAVETEGRSAGRSRSARATSFTISTEQEKMRSKRRNWHKNRCHQHNRRITPLFPWPAPVTYLFRDVHDPCITLFTTVAVFRFKRIQEVGVGRQQIYG